MRLLGFIKRNSKSLFVSLVRPHLVYNIIIILAQTLEIGQGLGRFLSCGARKPEQT